MQLNPDCMRAVMLEIEQQWTLGRGNNGKLSMGSINLQNLCNLLPNFSEEDIFYSLFNLEQAEYLSVSISFTNARVVTSCDVKYITYQGHEFLNRIRDDKRWSVVKSGISAIRDYSLSAITSIAEGVVNAAINSYLSKL